MTSAAPRRIMIVGGGVTGLSLGYELQRRGAAVTLLERDHRVGGVLQTVTEGPFTFDRSANAMMVKGPEVFGLLDSLGLQDEVVDLGAVGRRRYIVRGGQPLLVPGSPLQGVTTRLFSLLGKLRVAAEPFIPKSGLDDESVGSFVRRRLGTDLLEYAIAPMVSGVWSGDPDALSVRHAFPKVWRLEAEFGSLIRGAIALQWQKFRGRGPSFKSTMVSFRGGMETLPKALADALGDSVKLNARITKIEMNPWRIHWVQDGEAQMATVDDLILAVPAFAVGAVPLPEPVAATVKFLDSIPHAAVSTISLAVDKANVDHPLDGFGMLVPRVEERQVLGSLFPSSLVPGRAPNDGAVLTAFMGGALRPELAAYSEQKAATTVQSEFRELLGLRGAPKTVVHTPWPRAIPQYHVGYGSVLKSIDSAEKSHPGLWLAGAYHGGPGVSDRVAQGIQIAERVSKQEPVHDAQRAIRAS